jgi:hypothetical protein
MKFFFISPPPASHAFLRRGGGLDARQAAGRLTPCLRAGRALVTGSGPAHALLMGESGESQRETVSNESAAIASAADGLKRVRAFSMLPRRAGCGEVYPVVRRQLVERPLPPDRFQGHLHLEFGTMLPPLHTHRFPLPQASKP